MGSHQIRCSSGHRSGLLHRNTPTLTMRSLLQILGEVHRGLLLLAILAGLASGAATVGLLRVVGLELEALGDGAAQVGSFWAWALGLCLVRAVAGTAAHVVMGWLTQESLRCTRRRFAGAVMRAPLRNVERVERSRLYAAFGEDVQQVSQAVVNLPYFFVNLVILGGCLVYLGWVSLTLLLVTSAALAVGAVSYFLPVALANRQLVAARVAHRNLCSTFADAISGIAEFRLDRERRSRYFDDRLDPQLCAVSNRLMQGTWIYASAANWNRLLFFVYVFGILYLLPEAAGGEPLRVAGSILVVLYMMAPLEGVLNATPHLGRAFASLDQIQELLNELTPGKAVLDRSPEDLELGDDPVVRIDLEGVIYAYDDGALGEDGEPAVAAVGPVSASFYAGEVAFLVGGNGAGKSTLLKVAAGLYPSSDGAVRVHRRSGGVESVSADRLRASGIFHAFHLFEEDTTFGNQQGLPESLQSLFATAGARSSAGERKRRALEAEIARDRDVYFFDEWAAEQEPGFRETFYDVILPELRKRGKLVIVASHDDAFFASADQVIELRDGRLARITRPNSTQVTLHPSE